MEEPSSLTAPSREMDRYLAGLGFSNYSSLPGSGNIPPRLLEWAIMIDEVSSVSPKLGRSLTAAGGEETASHGPTTTASILAWTIGAASFVLIASFRAAREKGLFESVLMGFRTVQDRLATVLCGIEAARLQTFRALCLLDGNDRQRGEEELARALDRALETFADARALASSLLGETWIGRYVPEEAAVGHRKEMSVENLQ